MELVKSIYLNKEGRKFNNNYQELIKINSSFSCIVDRVKNHKNINSKKKVLTEIYSCSFLGKTGYGKSSTINKIIGKTLFKTSLNVPCTKKIYNIDYCLNNEKTKYLRFCDLPGLGENISADKKYLKIYNQILKKSVLVIYLFRADQRDYSIDLQLFNSFLNDKNGSILIGLNYCDKISPINRKLPFKPSPKQINNIKKKIQNISVKFSIDKKWIIPYSAEQNWNITKLKKTIAFKICSIL